MHENTHVAEPFPPRTDTAEALLETGLLNLWYLVAPAEWVTDRPLGLRRLARNVVLWRDTGGKVRVLEDYCPHRGAPLSLGVTCEGDVVCPYHGFRLNGEGCVTAVPPAPDSAILGKKAVKSYPVREFAGAIWVYFGDALHADPPEPLFPEELTSPEWSGFLFTGEWACNWQITLDNRTDPIHGSYLHGGTFTLDYGRKDARLDIRDTAHGFETMRDNQRGVNIDWHEVELHPDNIMWVRTEIPYPPKAGGGAFRINGFPTPIDRDRTFVWFYRSRKISGWQRDMWRFLYRNRLVKYAHQVVEQDRILLERMSLESRRREQMIRTDVAVTRMRRLLSAEADRQLAALASAKAKAKEKA